MQITFDHIEPLNSAPFPFTDLQRQWLAALRSKNYKQGRGVLKDSYDQYCCLGVLAELAGCKAELPSGAMTYMFQDIEGPEPTYATSVPYFAAKQIGLLSGRGNFKLPRVLLPQFNIGPFGGLASMNDCRVIPDVGKLRSFTFDEIANYIEHDPWNVFEPVKTCAEPPISP